jgi:iron complex outermembrane receptor protein
VKRADRSSKLLAGTSLALLFAIATPMVARAAEEATEIETLIVTASKRAENIQDVPMSVSAVSGDYLEKSGIDNATDLVRFMPSVGITSTNNNRNTTVFIRGIGTSGTNPGIESSVGIFIDGVYVLAAGPIQANLQDISTVEVLRGPQGTLYGRNTPVGAINITTREPTQSFETMISGRVGDYDDRSIAGYVGGGLTDSLAGRLSFWASARDGYETNLYTGESVNGNEQYGFRGRLKWQPIDTLSANLVGYYARIHSKCCTPETLSPAGPGGIATPGFLAAAAATGHPFRNYDDGDHVVDDNREGLDTTKIYGASLNVDWDLPNGHTLTSITAFNGYVDDVAQLAADGLPQATAVGAQYLRAEGYSEELRIASPLDQRISYLAGVFLFSESLTHTTGLTLGPDANRVLPPNRPFTQGDGYEFYYTQKTRSAAVFGQATFNATDSLRFTAGLRYSWDKKDSYIDSDVKPGSSPAARVVFPVNHLGDVSRKESKPTWSTGVQYDLAPRVMVYALAASGYKTGGFNAKSAPVSEPIEFDAETSLTYEAGIKSTLLDGRMVLNADVYTMRLKNFQDSILNPVTNAGFIVSNAGDRRVRGMEFEGQFHPIEPLSIRASASYLDGEFTDYTDGQCYTGKTPDGSKPGTCNYNGLTPAQNPKWSWSLSGLWQAPLAGAGLEWFAGADVSYTGSKQLEPKLSPLSFQESVILVGARIGITSPVAGWRLAVFGKNLGDESYFTYKTAQPLGAFIGAGGVSSAAGYVGFYGPPRTWGVEASMKF